MTVVEWREPALLWGVNLTAVSRPKILEFRQDDFIPLFLEGMASTDPGTFVHEHLLPAAKVSKLYQPLHGRYYLVAASLVCRQVGLPDKRINKADGEEISFVIRRISKNGEDAWIDNGDGGRWQTVAPHDTHTVLAHEETFPMHPAAMCPKPENPQSPFTDFVDRNLHFGYIPTGNRKKYLETLKRETTQTGATQTVVDFIEKVQQENSDKNYDFRFDVFVRRVEIPWQRFVTGSVSALSPTSAEQIQLYILLELGDYIKTYLPTLWQELLKTPTVNPDLPPGMREVYEMLTDSINHPVNNDPNYSIRDALIDLRNHFNLVRGIGSEPTETYDIRNALSDSEINTLKGHIKVATQEENKAPVKPDVADDDEYELLRLIRNQVRPEPKNEQSYIIRAVYDYDPDCPPVVSEPGPVFTLAKMLEPDAPARLLQLEAPSIKLKDLRRYSRGVGVSMSPELHKLASCIRGGDLQGVMDNLSSSCDDGINIQMICTFSIQIIFLVAFIVMFIFLISLNFIFWWLAFLRICLPIPRRE